MPNEPGCPLISVWMKLYWLSPLGLATTMPLPGRGTGSRNLASLPPIAASAAGAASNGSASAAPTPAPYCRNRRRDRAVILRHPPVWVNATAPDPRPPSLVGTVPASKGRTSRLRRVGRGRAVRRGGSQARDSRGDELVELRVGWPVGARRGEHDGDVPVGVVLGPPRDGLPVPQEAVGDGGREVPVQVHAAVADVGLWRAQLGVLPVHHASHRAAAPEHVARVVVAVDEAPLRQGRRRLVQRDGLVPHPLGQPRPG